ncbi:MAG: hypothetical protein U9Q81_01255 [Pseudomonadota bacterium]|nr:hypothetical protein [Pseudomonadota bacterium]
MIPLRHALLLMLTAVALAPAHGANTLRGRLLYDNFCHHCHMPEIHYRVNSRVDSRAELRRMVAVWQEEMKLGWDDQDVRDVASYLDHVYYRLPDSGRRTE